MFVSTKYLVNINYRYFTFDMYNRYWKLNEKALDRSLWRTRLRRGYNPVVKQITK